MVRVIAGKAKGKKLKSVRGKNTRPTTDRVKEAMFSVLYTAVEGARVLDLFAGTGALGIEALSRGASEAVFVEKDRRAVAVIRDNLRATGLVERAKVFSVDVFSGLARAARSGKVYDLVFADPPYDSDYAGQILEKLAGDGLLAGGGMVVVEHAAKKDLPARVQNLCLIKHKTYGDTAVSFYQGE